MKVLLVAKTKNFAESMRKHVMLPEGAKVAMLSLSDPRAGEQILGMAFDAIIMDELIPFADLPDELKAGLHACIRRANQEAGIK